MRVFPKECIDLTLQKAIVFRKSLDLGEMFAGCTERIDCHSPMLGDESGSTAQLSGVPRTTSRMTRYVKLHRAVRQVHVGHHPHSTRKPPVSSRTDWTVAISRRPPDGFVARAECASACVIGNWYEPLPLVQLAHGIGIEVVSELHGWLSLTAMGPGSM